MCERKKQKDQKRPKTVIGTCVMVTVGISLKAFLFNKYNSFKID